MLHAFKYMVQSDRKDFISERNRDIMSHLKFIGTIQPNEKMDVKNRCIENYTLFTPIKRTLLGESRTTTYQFLTSTIDRSFEIVYAYCKSSKISEQLLCKNILIDMNKAILGLQNIQKTYKEDKQFCCDIDVLIQSIESMMEEFRTTNPELFKLAEQKYLMNYEQIQYEQIEPPQPIVLKEEQKVQPVQNVKEETEGKKNKK